MIAVLFVALFVATIMSPMLFIQYQERELTVGFLSIVVFCSVNFMICLWEIVLYFYVDKIKNDYLHLKKKLPKGDIGKVFLFEDYPLSTLMTPSFWGRVWSTYSLVDPSYSDTKSFGWSIDIGNGFSTIPPMLGFVYAITYQDKLELGPMVLDVKVLGLLGFVSFYQMFYGTVLYFNQYIVNQHWKLHNNTWAQLFFLVLCSNVLWMLGPAFGMLISYDMLFSQSPFARIN